MSDEPKKELNRFWRWRHRVWGFNIYNRRQWVAEQARRLPAGTRVLDAGAGIGQYRSLFGHCEYKTQDFAQEPATVGKYTPLDFECDITAIPVPDGAFDAVLCTEVLEHVPYPIEALKEMARILKPGGRILLTAPLPSYLHQEPFHYYGGYTPYWYQRFLPETGFELESIEANQGFFSLFGQEAQRYVEILRSPQARKTPFLIRTQLSLLAFLMLPLKHVLPLFGNWLDRLHLETMATAGYHVVGRRKTS